MVLLDFSTSYSTVRSSVLVPRIISQILAMVASSSSDASFFPSMIWASAWVYFTMNSVGDTRGACNTWCFNLNVSLNLTSLVSVTAFIMQ